MANIEVHIPDSTVEDLADRVAGLLKNRNDPRDLNIDEVKEIIEDLTSKVDDLESTVEDFPGEYSSQDAVEEVERRIDDVSSTLDDFKEQLDELKSKVHGIDLGLADMNRRFDDLLNSLRVAADRFSHS